MSLGGKKKDERDSIIMQGPQELSYILLLQIRDLGAVLRENKDIKNNLLSASKKKTKNNRSLELFVSQGFYAKVRVLRNRC